MAKYLDQPLKGRGATGNPDNRFEAGYVLPRLPPLRSDLFRVPGGRREQLALF